MKTCAHCGDTIYREPYKAWNGKEYCNAYCYMIEQKVCDICGGYTGSDFDKSKHDFKCNGHGGGFWE